MKKRGSLFADKVHRQNIAWLINNGKTKELRREQRLCYDWPICFAEDFKKTLFQGWMLNVSSMGAAFICDADSRPYPGQHITTRFRVPRFGSADPFNVVLFTHVARICRIDDIDNLLRRVAIKFVRPLFFKPGEQGISKSDVQQRLKAVRSRWAGNGRATVSCRPGATGRIKSKTNKTRTAQGRS